MCKPRMALAHSCSSPVIIDVSMRPERQCKSGGDPRKTQVKHGKAPSWWYSLMDASFLFKGSTVYVLLSQAFFGRGWLCCPRNYLWIQKVYTLQWKHDHRTPFKVMLLGEHNHALPMLITHSVLPSLKEIIAWTPSCWGRVQLKNLFLCPELG